MEENERAREREGETERKEAPSGSRTTREREKARGRDPDPRQSAPTRPSSAPLPWNCVRAPCQLAEHGPRTSREFTEMLEKSRKTPQRCRNDGPETYRGGPLLRQKGRESKTSWISHFIAHLDLPPKY